MNWNTADKWHDDDGPVLWARFDGGGWPDVRFGSPLDSDWDMRARFTHWCKLPDTPLDAIAFTLECSWCDTSGPGSREKAEAEGWKDIEYNDGASWNFLGTCPECAKEDARDATEKV